MANLMGCLISIKESAIKTHISSLESHQKANKLRHHVQDIIKALNNYLINTNTLPTLEKTLEKYRRATLGDAIVQPKGPLVFVAKETLARNIRREQIVYDLDETARQAEEAEKAKLFDADEERYTA